MRRDPRGTPLASRVLPALIAATLLALSPARGEAQLLSPGRLARAHASVEGLRNCTSCHELGRSGVSAERCLDCHEPVRQRIASGRGYHATVPPDDCASCHQEHLGTDFELVRLDEGSFDHSTTGYDLELSHARVECRDCHEPSHVADPAVRSALSEGGALDRTFLGLATTCEGCHRGDSPHAGEFTARGCNECHDPGEWEASPLFDHSATAFPLEGLHAPVACAECHGTGSDARYQTLSFGTCNGCHADPHVGAMAGSCATCHSTGGWTRVAAAAVGSAFDHTRTSFTLRGVHAEAECTACHRPSRPPRSERIAMSYRAGTADRTYPRPVADSCISCHVDSHEPWGTPPRWSDCASCHGETGWVPSMFGLARHAESDFQLTGAHAATPCGACHTTEATSSAFSLSVAARDCVGCHQADDPHEGRYADLACESCHSTSAFADVSFDHDLLGDPSSGCIGCHSADDPHSGQFEGSDCGSCHATDAFAIERFDHSATRFPLDGAHRDTECAGCHVTEGPEERRFVRYTPLGVECTNCHGGTR